jgi:LPXTG-motif cell wall-anchored protein
VHRKNHRVSSVGRLVGACAIIGALLAGPLAGAGSAASTDSFAGQGTGFALRIVMDLSGLPKPATDAIQANYTTFRNALPTAEARSLLPATFPLVIDQRFIQTLADLGSTTQAHSLLGQGFKNFTQSANATKVGQTSSVTTATQMLPSADLPLLNVSAGKLNAAVSSLSNVTSSGTLASVAAGLPVGILPPAVTQALTDVTANLNSVITTANATLDGVLGQVATAYTAAAPSDPILGPILGQVGLETIVTNATTLKNTVNLPTVLGSLLTQTASLTGLANSASTDESGSKTVANAASKIGSIDVLGLLHVGLVDMKSHSEAAGTAGTAHNSSSCSLTTLNLGAAGVSIDGKQLIVNGTPVPVPAADIDAIKSAVNTVMSAAGLKVGLCDIAKGTTAKNGTSASQTLSALSSEVAPLAGGDPNVNPTLGITTGTPLLKLLIDPSVETSASANLAAAAAPNLPRTGQSALPTIVIGLIVAAGGAMFLLRHRLASLVGARSN